jgi:hypothetical protein
MVYDCKALGRYYNRSEEGRSKSEWCEGSGNWLDYTMGLIHAIGQSSRVVCTLYCVDLA